MTPQVAGLRAMLAILGLFLLVLGYQVALAAANTLSILVGVGMGIVGIVWLVLAMSGES